MKSISLKRFTTIACLAVFTVPLQLGGQENQSNQKECEKEEPFTISSTTFKDGGVLPISMALNQAGCAPDINNSGGVGQDLSPEVSWTHPKHGTRSLVVVLFDRTASFTHWGMYNISPETTELPEGAGIAGSKYGLQAGNDFGVEEYDGPCPPTNFTPTTHEYVLTVYALDVDLTLPKGSADFPPLSEILYHKLIEAARGGHILESASMTATFSALTPAN